MNTPPTQLAYRFSNRCFSQSARVSRRLLVLLMAFATGSGACSKSDGAEENVEVKSPSNPAQDRKLGDVPLEELEALTATARYNELIEMSNIRG